MMGKIRFGIVGTSNIANIFLRADLGLKTLNWLLYILEI